ncbi:putative disease resistance protein At3g14460 [Mangifera indica]|uniref:putative disease resistance protein At3g14460 n=1 Tax=Mangifera indica TaxID=29780 RepID=UPI001CFB7138|nr:putative disease resistance protein At3g14460 [Mangifera indica]
MLPSVGKLPFPKHLVIKGIASIQSVGKELYGYSEVPFPLLETICFWGMKGWEVWIPHEEEEAKAFPHLRELSIKLCSKLEGLLPKYLPSLEKLVIRSCEKLVVSIESLPRLCKLDIVGCEQMMWGSTIDLSSLKSVVLWDISTHICSTEIFTYGLLKVEEMVIYGSKELTSLCQSTAEWLQDNSSLCRLEIWQCPQLPCGVAEEEEEEGQEQLGMPCRLEYLELNQCERFEKLPKSLCGLSFLEEICITDCPKLVSFPETSMPPQLRIIEIEECNALKSLPEAWMNNSNTYLESLSIKNGTHSNTSLLQFLVVNSCRSLTSLWSRSELPDTLEHIKLWRCYSLASLSSGGNLPMALKSLIDLHKLRHLQKMTIPDCPKLVSFPEEGLPLGNLTSLCIDSCKKLKALPNRIHKLTALKHLSIKNCPSMAMFPVHGFPISLASLEIQDLNIFKPLFDWGLYRLTSLRNLSIGKGCPEVVSFPQEESGMMLPTSLTHLKIQNFLNLERLSSDIQNLTCLEKLCLFACPKLKFLPEDCLPFSLLQLQICDCPLLKQIWEKHGGQNYWPMIARIPLVIIDCLIMKYRPHDQD